MTSSPLNPSEHFSKLLALFKDPPLGMLGFDFAGFPQINPQTMRPYFATAVKIMETPDIFHGGGGEPHISK